MIDRVTDDLNDITIPINIAVGEVNGARRGENYRIKMLIFPYGNRCQFRTKSRRPATRSYVWGPDATAQSICKQVGPAILAKRADSPRRARLIARDAKTSTHFYGSLLRPSRRLGSRRGIAPYILHDFYLMLKWGKYRELRQRFLPRFCQIKYPSEK